MDTHYSARWLDNARADTDDAQYCVGIVSGNRCRRCGDRKEVPLGALPRGTNTPPLVCAGEVEEKNGRTYAKASDSTAMKASASTYTVSQRLGTCTSK